MFLFIAIPIFILISIISFEYLIWYEINFQRSAWEKDGRPLAMFADPDGVRGAFSFSKKRARGRCSLLWLVSTPYWIEYEKRLGITLNIYRASMAGIPITIAVTVVYLYIKAYG